MNEQAVIQSVQQGNTEAFRVLFEENRQKSDSRIDQNCQEGRGCGCLPLSF